MKRAFFFLIFILIVYIGFAQDILGEAVSVLDNQVTSDFEFLDQSGNFKIYVNNNFYDGNLVLLARKEDNIVVISSIGATFDTEDEANRWAEQFHKILDNQGWKYDGKHYDNELYVKDRFFLSIEPVSKKEYPDKIKYSIRINVSWWLLGLLTIVILY